MFIQAFQTNLPSVQGDPDNETCNIKGSLKRNLNYIKIISKWTSL